MRFARVPFLTMYVFSTHKHRKCKRKRAYNTVTPIVQADVTCMYTYSRRALQLQSSRRAALHHVTCRLVLLSNIQTPDFRYVLIHIRVGAFSGKIPLLLGAVCNSSCVRTKPFLDKGVKRGSQLNPIYTKAYPGSKNMTYTYAQFVVAIISPLCLILYCAVYDDHNYSYLKLTTYSAYVVRSTSTRYTFFMIVWLYKYIPGICRKGATIVYHKTTGIASMQQVRYRDTPLHVAFLCRKHPKGLRPL